MAENHFDRELIDPRTGGPSFGSLQGVGTNFLTSSFNIKPEMAERLPPNTSIIVSNRETQPNAKYQAGWDESRKLLGRNFIEAGPEMSGHVLHGKPTFALNDRGQVTGFKISTSNMTTAARTLDSQRSTSQMNFAWETTTDKAILKEAQMLHGAMRNGIDMRRMQSVAARMEHIAVNVPGGTTIEQKLVNMLGQGSGKVHIGTASLYNPQMVQAIAQRAGRSQVDITAGFMFFARDSEKNLPRHLQHNKDGKTLQQAVHSEETRLRGLFRRYVNDPKALANIKLGIVLDEHGNWMAMGGDRPAAYVGSGRDSKAIGTWGNEEPYGTKAGFLEIGLMLKGKKYGADIQQIIDITSKELANYDATKKFTVPLLQPTRSKDMPKPATINRDRMGLDDLLLELQSNRSVPGYAGTKTKWYVEFELSSMTREMMRNDKSSHIRGAGLASYLYRSMSAQNDPMKRGPGDFAVPSWISDIDTKLMHGKSFGEAAWGQIGTYGPLWSRLHKWAVNRDKAEYDRQVKELNSKALWYRRSVPEFDAQHSPTAGLVNFAGTLDSIFTVLGGFQVAGAVNSGLHRAAEKFLGPGGRSGGMAIDVLYDMSNRPGGTKPNMLTRALGIAAEGILAIPRGFGLMMSEVSASILQGLPNLTPEAVQHLHEMQTATSLEEAVIAGGKVRQESRAAKGIARYALAMSGLGQLSRGLDVELMAGRRVGAAIWRYGIGAAAVSSLAHTIAGQMGKAMPVTLDEQIRFANELNQGLGPGGEPLRVLYTAGYDIKRGAWHNAATMPFRFIKANAINFWNILQDMNRGYVPNVADSEALWRAGAATSKAQMLYKVLETGEFKGRKLTRTEMEEVHSLVKANQVHGVEQKKWGAQRAVNLGSPMMLQLGSSMMASAFIGIEAEVAPFQDDRATTTRYKFVTGLGGPFVFRGGISFEAPFILEQTNTDRARNTQFTVESLIPGATQDGVTYNLKYNPDANWSGLQHAGALLGGIYLATNMPEKMMGKEAKGVTARVAAKAIAAVKWLNPTYAAGELILGLSSGIQKSWSTTHWAQRQNRPNMLNQGHAVGAPIRIGADGRLPVEFHQALGTSSPGDFAHRQMVHTRHSYLAGAWRNSSYANPVLANKQINTFYGTRGTAVQHGLRIGYKLNRLQGRAFTAAVIGSALFQAETGWEYAIKGSYNKPFETKLTTDYVDRLRSIDGFFRSTPVQGGLRVLGGALDLMGDAMSFAPFVGTFLGGWMHGLGMWTRNFGVSLVAGTQAMWGFNGPKGHERLGGSTLKSSSDNWWGQALIEAQKGQGHEVSIGGALESAFGGLWGLTLGNNAYTGPKNRFIGGPEAMSAGGGMSFANLDQESLSIRNAFMRWSPTTMGDLTTGDTTMLRAYANKQAEAIAAMELRAITSGALDFKAPVANPLRPPRVSGVMFLGNSPVAQASPILRAAIEERYKLHNWSLYATAAQLQHALIGPQVDHRRKTRYGQYEQLKASINAALMRTEHAGFVMLKSPFGNTKGLGSKGPLTTFDVQSMTVAYLNAQTGMIKSGTSEVDLVVDQDWQSQNQFGGIHPMSLDVLSAQTMYKGWQFMTSLTGKLLLTGGAIAGGAVVAGLAINAGMGRGSLGRLTDWAARTGKPALGAFFGSVVSEAIGSEGATGFYQEGHEYFARRSADAPRLRTHATGMVTVEMRGRHFYNETMMEVFASDLTHEARGEVSLKMVQSGELARKRMSLGIAGETLVKHVRASGIGGIERKLARAVDVASHLEGTVGMVNEALDGMHFKDGRNAGVKKTIEEARNKLRAAATQLKVLGGSNFGSDLTSAGKRLDTLLKEVEKQSKILHAHGASLAGVQELGFGRMARFFRELGAAHGGVSAMKMIMVLPELLANAFKPVGRAGEQSTTRMRRLVNIVAKPFGAAVAEILGAGGAADIGGNVLEGSLNTAHSQSLTGKAMQANVGRKAMHVAGQTLIAGRTLAGKTVTGSLSMLVKGFSLATGVGGVWGAFAAFSDDLTHSQREMYARQAGIGGVVAFDRYVVQGMLAPRLNDAFSLYLANRATAMSAAQAASQAAGHAAARAGAGAAAASRVGGAGARTAGSAVSTGAARSAMATKVGARFAGGAAVRAAGTAGAARTIGTAATAATARAAAGSAVVMQTSAAASLAIRGVGLVVKGLAVVPLIATALNFGYEWFVQDRLYKSGMVTKGGMADSILNGLFGKYGVAGLAAGRFIEDGIVWGVVKSAEAAQSFGSSFTATARNATHMVRSTIHTLLQDMTVAEAKIHHQQAKIMGGGVGSSLQLALLSVGKMALGMMDSVATSTFRPQLPGMSLSLTNSTIAQTSWAFRGSQRDWAQQWMNRQEQIRLNYEIGSSLDYMVGSGTLGRIDPQGGEFFQLADAPGAIYESRPAGLGTYAQDLPRIGAKYLPHTDHNSVTMRVLQTRAIAGDFALARLVRAHGQANDLYQMPKNVSAQDHDKIRKDKRKRLDDSKPARRADTRLGQDTDPEKAEDKTVRSQHDSAATGVPMASQTWTDWFNNSTFGKWWNGATQAGGAEYRERPGSVANPPGMLDVHKDSAVGKVQTAKPGQSKVDKIGVGRTAIERFMGGQRGQDMHAHEARGSAGFDLLRYEGQQIFGIASKAGWKLTSVSYNARGGWMYSGTDLGTGYSVSYMHAQEGQALADRANLVGKVFHAGEGFGKVGRTGSSSGNHVHLQVRNKSGANVDPSAYAEMVATGVPMPNITDAQAVAESAGVAGSWSPWLQKILQQMRKAVVGAEQSQETVPQNVVISANHIDPATNVTVYSAVAVKSGNQKMAAYTIQSKLGCQDPAMVYYSDGGGSVDPAWTSHLAG